MLEPNFHELEYKTAHRTKSVNFESYIKKTQGTGIELSDELISKIGELSKKSSKSANDIVDQLNKRAQLEKERGYKLGILKSFV